MGCPLRRRLRSRGLEVVALPDDLRAEIDALLPSRWSRNNPVDMAGGESRDTIPTLLDLVTRHPAVDAVIYLGLGIQAANAGVLKSGEFYPGYGLDRIVAFHERQDARYAEVAKEVSERYDKPVLSRASSPSPTAPGRTPRRARSRRGTAALSVGAPSRAALAHLVRYAEWRRRRS